MTIELINQTNTANIYGVYDPTGKAIGTVESKLIGPDAGTHCYSLSGKYSRRDIQRIYNNYRKTGIC